MVILCRYIDQDDDDLPPPRLFCDICDEFDLHDTDDCPLQAQSDSSPPPSMHHGLRGSERPYCDKCEGECTCQTLFIMHTVIVDTG